ncbi:MAG TPA: UDP-N-acetylmuramoyl-tripeptide--D-alanyl-D-alanine ligase [Candidatus Binatia bacterium]|nr:UDP-N-acetylmuramoyl-tripeptide--D-alanyl-D-alanine ligase [Candidatus Binatia bacterium]
MAWTVQEIVAATGGDIVRPGSKARLGEVVTDSTKVKNGSVFVALKGERRDGHGFIADAVQRGAACIIAHREVAKSILGEATVVRVPDTLRALGDLAHYRRMRLAPKVLAITGSNGKTTTKEMVASILEEATLDGRPLRGRVLKTEGNFNNLVGLPLTLLRLRKKDKIAVLELGTNHPGEIRRLAEIAAPDAGIVTSVAAAHLEGLSSLAGVAREKGALYRGVRADGAIAVNLDDPWVVKIARRFNGKKITYGGRGQVRARACRLDDARGMRFTLCAGRQSCDVRLHYLGRHNVTNALGAAALSLCAGAKLPAIRRGLEKARPFAMRMEVQSWRGIGIINDTYNANPASMKAALKTLAEIPCSGKKIAVLGDMFELGKHSRKEHYELGKTAALSGVDALYLLGEQAAQVRRGALAGGMAQARIAIGKNHADVARRLGERAQRGDWLLFKGSRGMKMEEIVRRFKERKA